jgi:hypothetical protein
MDIDQEIKDEIDLVKRNAVLELVQKTNQYIFEITRTRNKAIRDIYRMSPDKVHLNQEVRK